MSKNGIHDPIVVKGASEDIFGDDVVIRGYIEPVHLPRLFIDTYQREQRPEGRLADMIAAVSASSRLPDAELNMRGKNYRMVGKGIVHVMDPLAVLDGQQRRAAVLEACRLHLGLEARFGVIIHVNRSIEWERDRFEILNLRREAVKKQVLLRNRADDRHPIIATMLGLSTNDREWVMHKRVTWTQDARNADLINAWTLARLMCNLHAHKVSLSGSSFDDVVRALDGCEKAFGLQAFRGNTRTFFDAIDKAWNIRDIMIKSGAIFLRNNSLVMLARTMCKYHDFWRPGDEKHLVIDRDAIERMKFFKWHDPQVANVLTVEAGRLQELEDKFVEKLNYRRRNKMRLRKNSISLTKSNVVEELEEVV